MQWTILVGPIVGAIIGYVTNKIAVEMLFRPHKAMYIGTFHVPLTPGIIPKGKGRLAKALGDAVGNSLLTPDMIKQTLLSDNIKVHIKENLDTLFNNLSRDQSTLALKLHESIGEEKTDDLTSRVQQTLTQKVNHGLISMNLGEIVAGEVFSAVQEKIQGTMIAMMMNEAMLSPIVEEIKIRVNQYIEHKGEENVGKFIEEEVTILMGQPISSLLVNVDTDELKQAIVNLYPIIVNNYAEKLLTTLNLSKIVEEKVSAMEIQEVEDLVLSIMKKELGVVVNLGALIGFILGLINVLF